ncbi:hypothetical protein [Cupriavidus sp. RAF12]|uniref:hypothetical protein n=1 Tax=Cupriavidus sp. RAF12 TaxID=3233050 RepID=UPI003F93BBB2
MPELDDLAALVRKGHAALRVVLPDVSVAIEHCAARDELVVRMRERWQDRIEILPDLVGKVIANHAFAKRAQVCASGCASGCCRHRSLRRTFVRALPCWFWMAVRRRQLSAWEPKKTVADWRFRRRAFSHQQAVALMTG